MLNCLTRMERLRNKIMAIYRHTFVSKGIRWKICITDPPENWNIHLSEPSGKYAPNTSLSNEVTSQGTYRKYVFFLSKEMIADEVVLMAYFKDFVNDLNKKQ